MDDKPLHLIVCMVISAAVATTLGMAGASVSVAALSGFSSAMMVGVAKEAYDCRKPHPTGFSVPDIMYDALGSLVGLVLYLLVAGGA